MTPTQAARLHFFRMARHRAPFGPSPTAQAPEASPPSPKGKTHG